MEQKMTITRKQIRQLVEAELKQSSTWKSLKIDDLHKVKTKGEFTINYQGPKQMIVTVHLEDSVEKSKMYDLVVNVDEKTNYNIHTI